MCWSLDARNLCAEQMQDKLSPILFHTSADCLTSSLRGCRGHRHWIWLSCQRLCKALTGERIVEM